MDISGAAQSVLHINFYWFNAATSACTFPLPNCSTVSHHAAAAPGTVTV